MNANENPMSPPNLFALISMHSESESESLHSVRPKYCFVYKTSKAMIVHSRKEATIKQILVIFGTQYMIRSYLCYFELRIVKSK